MPEPNQGAMTMHFSQLLATSQARSLLVRLAIAAAVCGADQTTLAGDSKVTTQAQAAHDGSRDFDFLYGKWSIHNRRLATRLAGSHEWIEFESTNECHPLPGGLGNEDIYRTTYWPNFVGMTYRFYNPVTRQWALWWIDNRNNLGLLQPPVVGSFNGNIGVFEGPDEFEGKPIVVRFTWTLIDADHLRWEQAFSPDAGKSWETNWTMEVARSAG
jgi:hypothetical protein